MVLISVISGLLMCTVALLIWISLVKTGDLNSADKSPIKSYVADSSSSTEVSGVSTTSTTSDTSAVKAEASAGNETVQASAKAETGTETGAGTETETQQTTDSISLDIDEAITKVQGTTDYLKASDYSVDETEDSTNVVNQGVELKKPVIAQNLSVNQTASVSKDIVKYTDYMLQTGDSLDSIAQKFGISRETIISVNQIRNTTSLFAGTTLSIPDRDGTMYTVKEGDTLSSIVQQLNLSLGWKALSDVNGLKSDEVEPGQKLFIPLESVQETGTLSAQEELSFLLPSSDAVTVGLYNQKVPNPIGNNAIQLDGILMQASEGTAVCASADGTVIDKGFNDNGSGFVKVLHTNGYTTLYNYLADICVNTTDRVSQGTVLGYFASETTNLLSPTIFFKIEQDGISLDPYSFL